MKAGKNCKSEYGGVDGWQVIAGVVRDAGGKHYGRDSNNLNGGVDLSEPGWPEPAEPGHDIYRGRAHDNKYVPANHDDSDPEGYRQVTGNRSGKNAAH